jgi:hypothetical protein
MSCRNLAPILAVLLVLTTATRSSGQDRSWLHVTAGGGPAFPVASNPDGLGTGYHLQAGAEIGPPHSLLTIRIEGLHESFSAGYPFTVWPCTAPKCGTSPGRPGSERVEAATLNVVMEAPGGRVGFLPYAIAGAGAYHTSNDGAGGVKLDERLGTNPGWNLGAGLRQTRLHLFVEVRMLALHNVRYLPLTFGLRF